jgi:hypothetical protein
MELLLNVEFACEELHDKVVDREGTGDFIAVIGCGGGTVPLEEFAEISAVFDPEGF